MTRKRLCFWGWIRWVINILRGVHSHRYTDTGWVCEKIAIKGCTALLILNSFAFANLSSMSIVFLKNLAADLILYNGLQHFLFHYPLPVREWLLNHPRSRSHAHSALYPAAWAKRKINRDPLAIRCVAIRQPFSVCWCENMLKCWFADDSMPVYRFHVQRHVQTPWAYNTGKSSSWFPVITFDPFGVMKSTGHCRYKYMTPSGIRVNLR